MLANINDIIWHHQDTMNQADKLSVFHISSTYASSWFPNSFSPGQCKAIIWTKTGILSTRPLETNFSEILIKNFAFLFKKMHLKKPYAKIVAILSQPQFVYAF